MAPNSKLAEGELSGSISTGSQSIVRATHANPLKAALNRELNRLHSLINVTRARAKRFARRLLSKDGTSSAPLSSGPGRRSALQPVIDFGRVRFVDDSARARKHFALGPWTAVTELHFGGFMVYDTRNVDTVPGPVREGWAEPWNDIMLRALLHEGDVYVNVGANYGYFTLLGGRLVGGSGRVVSFEANPSIFTHLMRSLFYNGTVNNTILFNRAVSNKDDDTIQFMFDPQFSGGGACNWQRGVLPETRSQEDCLWSEKNLQSLLDDRGRWKYGEVGLFSTFDARTITIDTALAGIVDRIDLLQMDIEGSEPLAILGAMEMLRKSPNPKVILEWAGHYSERPWLGDTCRRMWVFLVEELGLQAFHIHPTERDPYLLPPDLSHVPDFEAFCKLPHGEVYFARAGANAASSRSAPR